MTEICKLLKGQTSFRGGGAIASDAVADAERRLGLRFAKDYRAYLSAFGSARYFGHELTGLDCPRHIDVVAATIEGRELYPDVPHDLYVIEEAQVDGIVFWQDAAGAIYEVVPNGRPVKLFSSLSQYVEKTAADS